MKSAAIYPRASSIRQKENRTIFSQLAALVECADRERGSREGLDWPSRDGRAGIQKKERGSPAPRETDCGMLVQAGRPRREILVQT